VLGTLFALKVSRNTLSKVLKTAITIRNSLQNLDGIINPFGKTIGIADIESIEYIGFPVFKHS